MKESKVFEVPMDQIKCEVLDYYLEGDFVANDVLNLVEAIARDVQNISERLIGTAWWNSFDNPHDRQNEITDMGWEIENLWNTENFDDGFYKPFYAIFESRGIDLNDRG